MPQTSVYLYACVCCVCMFLTEMRDTPVYLCMCAAVCLLANAKYKIRRKH